MIGGSYRRLHYVAPIFLHSASVPSASRNVSLKSLVIDYVRKQHLLLILILCLKIRLSKRWQGNRRRIVLAFIPCPYQNTGMVVLQHIAFLVYIQPLHRRLFAHVLVVLFLFKFWSSVSLFRFLHHFEASVRRNLLCRKVAGQWLENVIHLCREINQRSVTFLFSEDIWRAKAASILNWIVPSRFTL